MTEEELAQAVASFNAQVDKLNRKIDRVRFVERELILCAAVCYLAGIVLGVVIAKQWWGL